jgi:hypothetical protein
MQILDRGQELIEEAEALGATGIVVLKIARKVALRVELHDVEKLGGRVEDGGDVRVKEKLDENFFVEEDGSALRCAGKAAFGDKADCHRPESFFVVAFIEGAVRPSRKDFPDVVIVNLVDQGWRSHERGDDDQVFKRAVGSGCPKVEFMEGGWKKRGRWRNSEGKGGCSGL